MLVAVVLCQAAALLQGRLAVGLELLEAAGRGFSQPASRVAT